MRNEEYAMRFTCAMLIIAAAVNSTGCMLTSLFVKKAGVQWPTEQEWAVMQPAGDEGNGEVTLAAAAAIKAVIQDNEQGLFEGCSTPAAGLGATVFAWKGNYYVVVSQRFERCGGRRYRVLDWWEVYAVSPEGDVLGRGPYGF